MTKLGFSKFWIDRVISCISTPSFSICINGKSYGNIKPSKGLRQGDPLSPYLFLLCVEGFNSLLKKDELEDKLHGVKICRRAPNISYLLFADDSLLFCHATREEVKVIMEILHLYALASRKCINLEKSSVFFSRIQWQGKGIGLKAYWGLRRLTNSSHTWVYLP